MPRYVAFLRALNVGSSHVVRMDELRGIFESLGFDGVSSFIASGNIIFETPSRNTTEIEDRIEQALMQALGYEVTPFVRTGGDLEGIVRFKPFPPTSIAPQDQLAVIFLQDVASPESCAALAALRSGSDELHVRGREIHWLRHRTLAGEVYPVTPFERALGQPFTARSLGTVTKIAAKYFPHA